MDKPVSLINNFFIPKELENLSILRKYNYLKEKYDTGASYMLINNINVFGPFPEPELPWDISETQKIAIYHPEVVKVIKWVNTRIVINLSTMDYRTLGVLIRIATGMLNKCNIPNEVQILFHDNMVKNLQTEYGNIVTSDLPF